MPTVLNDLEAQFYFDQFLYVLKHPEYTRRTKLFKLNAGLVSLLNTLTEYREQQTFVSTYAKIHFIGEAYELPEEVLKSLYYSRRLLRRNLSSRSFEPAQEEVEFVIRTLAELVARFAALPIPEALQNLSVRLTDVDQSHMHLQELSGAVRATLIGQDKLDEEGVLLELVSDEMGRFEVVVRDIRFGKYMIRLTENCQFLKKNQTLLLTRLEYIEDVRWATSEETLLVIEPDYLVDASAIANCFKGSANSAYFMLLSRLSFFEGNVHTLRGNLTNELLDMLLRQPEISFSDAWEYALDKHKLLAAQVAHGELQAIRQEIQAEFGTLKRLFGAREKGVRLTAEPTFLSPTYGIQGRLDVLKEFEEQPNRKEIIELKSRKTNPPVERMGWPNDLIQIACYNLLLDSTYAKRRGSSSLLYSRDTESPLRDCGALNFEKQKAIMMRNRMVRLDWELSKGKTLIFQAFLNYIFTQDLPKFTQQDAYEFQKIWMHAKPVEKSYFAAFFGLVMREQIVAKVGGISGLEPSEGFASLWKSSASEKHDAFSLLEDLSVVRFDTEAMRLYLSRPEESATVTAFRQGDIVVLYPQQADELPTHFALLKGSIQQLNTEEVVLQLWTTYLSPQVFEDSKQLWSLEPNLMEKGFSHQMASLADFLRATPQKRALLLGQSPPRFAEKSAFSPLPELSQEQNEILERALAAKDYFLLQGPPGTGKTSRMIRNMVGELFEKTEEHIVLLAFTNRATDEICEKVKSVCGEDFIRLGQLAPEHPFYGQTLHSLKSLPEIREKLTGNRVFVSTVSSFFSNFQYVKRFDTLIVDEASQLLEPHLCGILPRFRRFILVGDEKQLPAVVTQPPVFCQTKDEALHALGIRDLSRSVFDRLIENATAKGWTDCYAMLSTQFRTHQDIAHFFNREFYKKLQVGSSRQTATWDWFAPDSKDENERLLASSRLLFVPTEAEAEMKFNRQEADRVAALVCCIADKLAAKGQFSEQSIGVITPYRAQIAEILRRLPQHLHGKVTVDTVERYQGSERDIILLSMAVNYPAMLRNLQAFDTRQRVDRKLNVALSRAREQLILLGNEEVLQQGVFYARLIDYIRAISPKAGGLLSD